MPGFLKGAWYRVVLSRRREESKYYYVDNKKKQLTLTGPVCFAEEMGTLAVMQNMPMNFCYVYD